MVGEVVGRDLEDHRRGGEGTAFRARGAACPAAGASVQESLRHLGVGVPDPAVEQVCRSTRRDSLDEGLDDGVAVLVSRHQHDSRLGAELPAEVRN